ncbi:hypothetical protein [Xenorhabdus miraniensis]|uniref:Uncharacterized protein n=1 Tax=Xenorhabdus miraniensis TaxID=351674 RepID=A0A2D0JVB2_9GAMM|nr:hypothetical protein [Xenorhabdus miraniensis]PHM50273.1 hypothetical protein Xmir_00452 [Xenorhabdus miraniensis]
MTLEDFVERSLGPSLRKKLEKINIGGSSNHKGTKYENYYAVAKICSSVANSMKDNSYDNYVLSAQERAFVDDLCWRVKDSGLKINYQAKNSENYVADWNNDLQERIKNQYHIDINYHKVKISRNVLLVSSKAKYRKNLKKIPIDLRTFCDCEYFPYFKSSTQLIMEHKPLRSDLEKICANKSLQSLDTAFKIIHSAWVMNDSQEVKTIGDIIGEAKSMSHPNIFHGLIPSRLTEKCATFNGCIASVESGIVYVRCRGLEVVVTDAYDQLTPEQLKQIDSATELHTFLDILTNITKQSFL